MDNRITFQYYNFLKDNTTGLSMHRFTSLQESAQVQLTDAVLDKIFDSMMAKYTKIDFNDIVQSKGNVTRFKHFDNMSKCIDMLVSIAESSSEKFNEAYVLRDARENLIKTAPLFEKGFATKNSYVIILYNTMVMALFQGTSAVISAMVDFINNGQSIEVCINKYKNSSQMMLVRSLEQFNEAVSDGNITAYIKESLNSSNIVHEAFGLGTVALAIAVGSVIIPLIKQLIYLFYHTRNRISDAAQIQADFLEINIEILTNKDSEGNAKIIAKQQKVAEVFKRISRLFAVNNDRSQHDTEAELKREPVTNVDDIVF